MTAYVFIFQKNISDFMILVCKPHEAVRKQIGRVQTINICFIMWVFVQNYRAIFLRNNATLPREYFTPSFKSSIQKFRPRQ